MKTYGDYLDGSGWTNALVQAGIASSGTADSFLRASHLTRTRHAHQVTALVLAKLQDEAFLHAGGVFTDEAKEAWKLEMTQKSPTFQYWDTVLNMELMGLMFIRSHREGNFSLYVECLKAIVPWFFALDHHNYARWIPIHIRDMESLPASILIEFEENGCWIIQKTSNRFSSIAIDQAHEQNNAIVKGSGGAVGLTEPFSLHNSDELLALDTRNVLNESVVNTVRTAYSLGKDQYATYFKEVIIDRTRSIHEPIKKNLLPLFSRPQAKSKTKQAGKISLLKNDVALFSHLYIVLQHRASDMTTFFSHENHPFPPSLSDNGKLRLGKKI